MLTRLPFVVFAKLSQLVASTGLKEGKHCQMLMDVVLRGSRYPAFILVFE